MRHAMVFFCAAGVLFAAGCLFATNTSPPPGEGSSGSVDATAPPGQDSGSSPSAGANVPLQGAAFGAVIDDMSSAQSATGGSWYSYSSRSIPNSEPPILTTDAGTLNPLEGASFPPETGSGHVPPLVLDASDGGTLAFREFSGDAIPKWGAGFGLDLVSGLPDGGPVAINACPAGAIFDDEPDASGVGIPQPFDASAYTGFAFWGISLESSPLSVEVHVDDSDTTPWGGTFCDACKSSGQCTGSREAGTLDCPCSDNFYEPVTFEPGHWTQFAVRWSDKKFQANHWSDEGPLAFDAKHVYNIHFQDTITAASAPPFDIAVADLEWLTN